MAGAGHWLAVLTRSVHGGAINQRPRFLIPDFMAKCQTKYCRREAKRKRCYKCEHASRKEKNPYLYWFGVLRRNARRRQKYFALTFEYWVQWCDETGYLGIKGKHKGDGSVDCIINELGYIDGNIRVLTIEANAEKGIKYVDYNIATGDWDLVTWTPSPQPAPADDLPF